MRASFIPGRVGLGCVACLLAMQMSWARIAVAADAPTRQEPGQSTEPVQVCTFSVASLAELSDAAKAIGVDLPPVLSDRGIEDKLPFLRGHGLDATRPISVLVFMQPGWHLSGGQGVAIILPVNPETTPLDWFQKIGGTPVPDHPDTFNLPGATFRRTKDHLILAKPQDAALAVDPARLVDPYKADAAGNASLAHLSIDVATMRTSAPEQFREFFNLPRNDDANDPVGQVGRESATQWLQTVRRIDMEVRLTDHAVRVKLTTDPFAIPSPEREFTMPGMPADVMARIDLAIPPGWLRDGFDAFSQRIANARSPNDKPAGPREAAARADLLHEGTELFFSGKTWSLGISPNPKGVPAYFVEQEVEGSPRDRIQRFADRYNAVTQLQDPAHRNVAKVEFYTEGGLEVSRLKVLGNDRQETYVDLAGRGRNLYLTFSYDSGHYIKSLVGRAPEGKMSGAMSMRINLDRAMEAVLDMPDGQFKNLPALQREQWTRIFKGQSIDCKVEGEGDRMAVEMSLPDTLLRRISETMVGQQ